MIGGAGNDTYIVDDAGDLVYENENMGTELVRTFITYALPANIENLELLLGSSALNGTGNALGNVLTGNSAGNTLDGGAGSDVIAGGGGVDTLTGGTGSDRFDYNAIGEGGDSITDFTAGVGGDKLDIKDMLVGYNPSTSVLADFVQLSDSGGNTIVSVDADGAGGSDSSSQLVTLQGLTGLLLNDLITNGNLVVS